MSRKRIYATPEEAYAAKREQARKRYRSDPEFRRRHKAQSKAWRLANPDRFRALTTRWAAEWRKTPEGKEANRRQFRAWWLKNRERHNARRRKPGGWGPRK